MLDQSFLVSFICIAIHIIFTWKGMLLYPVGKWLQLRLNKYIKKPLFDCPMCMASFWTLMYWLIIQGEISILTFVMMLTVCGINTLLNTLIYALRENDDDEFVIENDDQLADVSSEIEKLVYDGCHIKKDVTTADKERAVMLSKAVMEYKNNKFKEKLKHD